MKIEGTTISEAVENLSSLRRYAPYRFGGRWHVAVINGQAHAQRKQSELSAKAAKAGLTALEIATLE